MKTRLRAAATGLATVAMFALGTAFLPSATASAQSSDLGSAGAAPAQPLAGINNFACRSEQHPRPVVLVHGTGMSMEQSWGPLNDALKLDNYCVFALNYGWGPSATRTDPFGLPGANAWGHTAIEASARELAAFIDTVRERTGAAQVDVVGHSQGGTMTRQYLKFEGGASGNKVHTLAMLGPSNHGTTMGGTYPNEAAAIAKGASKAMQQQAVNSTFLTQLNAGQETFPGIDYTVIASNTDSIITNTGSDGKPYSDPTLSFLAPGPSVENLIVQDECPGTTLKITHAGEENNAGDPQGLLNHSAPIFLVRKALDPTLAGMVPCSG
ncbi:esterase/lipase family protein [Rhodococcus sp. NPDC058514]|uniref:esterase/lipase family protein n=1 Tax=unclassified Rhodococcus (in: high G+C Gram-positive bacteria) TaxID=192944 RepID=UPI00365A87D9